MAQGAILTQKEPESLTEGDDTRGGRACREERKAASAPAIVHEVSDCAHRRLESRPRQPTLITAFWMQVELAF